MMSLSIKEILEAALDDRLGAVEESSHLYDDLGLDSMAAVAMVIEIQRRTGLKVPEDDIPSIMTAGELRQYIITLSGGQIDVLVP
jgi:acyl carrier protein